MTYFVLKSQFKNGNGSTITGMAIMLIVLVVAIATVQTFTTQVYAFDAQTAADSIADGTAAYMADNGGDFADAQKQAKALKSIVEQQTGLTIENLALDEDAFEDDLIEATVTIDGYYLTDQGGNNTYTITRSTTTHFNKMFSGLAEWMIEFAADDTHGYSMPNRTCNPDVDCSSFVYYALLNNGFTTAELGAGPFCTDNMGGILTSVGFKQYAYDDVKNNLQVGDICVYKAGFLGHSYGHTEVYVGDGQTVGAHSNYDKVTGDSSGKEVSVVTNSHPWQYVYRL